MSYDSVTSDLHRLAKSKNFTMFSKDLANNALPQWMFITPNMSKSHSLCRLRSLLTPQANDGHDTSVTTAGKWARSFLTPLLSNTNFMKKTLVLLSKSLFSVNSSILTEIQPSMKQQARQATIKYSPSC
jgi:hypothetical protein